MAQYSLAPESDDDDDEEIVTTFSNDELEEDEGYKPVDINNGEQRIRVLRTRLPMLLRVLIFAIVLTIVHLLLFWVVKEWLRPYEYKKAPHVYDLVIYRATPAGCAAAISAGEMAAHVLIIEPSAHVGGIMTEGGIGLRDSKAEFRLTDPRNSQIRWGVLNAMHYRLDQGTVWQPDNYVGEESFLKLLEDAGVEVRLNTNFKEGSRGVFLAKDSESPGKRIQALRLEGSSNEWVRAKFYIDASYEGELMQASGVSYTLGRESTHMYNESWAGIRKHSAAQFPVAVNPFQEDGSTLLRYIQDRPDPRSNLGQADDSVMSYSYRVCMTKDPNNKVPVTAPEGYDPADFELARRLVQTEVRDNIEVSAPWLYLDYMEYSRIPNTKQIKFDACCGMSPFGIDNPGLAVGYANATRAEKEIIAAEHRYFVQGLIWFWQNDSAVPASLRSEHSEYGLCQDEWPDNGHFPRQIYVREAVRMVGDHVFTQNDRSSECRDDSIGVATWFFDIHDVSRVAVKGENYSWSVMSEGLVGQDEDQILPFDLPYWVILPKKEQVSNLAVVNCPSVRHVAFSAVREEPTLWALGHAAGAAVAIAVAEGLTSFHDVDVVSLQQALSSQGGRLHFPADRVC